MGKRKMTGSILLRRKRKDVGVFTKFSCVPEEPSPFFRWSSTPNVFGEKTFLFYFVLRCVREHLGVCSFALAGRFTVELSIVQYLKKNTLFKHSWWCRLKASMTAEDGL